MKWLVCAFGSRGDVQPALVLADEARRRGHTVRVAVPPDQHAAAQGLGLDAMAVGLDYTRFIAESRGRIRAGMKRLRAEVAVQLEGLRDAAAHAELLVAVSVCGVGASLAERYRIPYRFVALSPAMVPSRAHASLLFPWRRLPRWMNAVSFWVADRLFDALYRRAFNDARASLGLRPCRHVWPLTLGQDVLLAVDPALAPTPLSTPQRRVVVTGALQSTAGPSAEPALPEAVEAFLRAGEPPIYLGFGSMFDAHPARTRQIAIGVGRTLGRRVLLGAGATHGERAPSPHLLAVGDVPHAHLFPRCAAVVHHGGSGTTHTALMAGVPQVVVPHLLDQYDFGARLCALGAAPVAIPKGRLSARTLTRALAAALDPRVSARTAELAASMRRDGARVAVDAVVHDLGGRLDRG